MVAGRPIDFSHCASSPHSGWRFAALSSRFAVASARCPGALSSEARSQRPTARTRTVRPSHQAVGVGFKSARARDNAGGEHDLYPVRNLGAGVTSGELELTSLTRENEVVCRGERRGAPGWLAEDRRGGAGVGGEPVQVFFGEGFGGPTGGVDDADGLAVVEDGDGEGVASGRWCGPAEASGPVP